jgi:hypothetical protein
VPTDVFITRSWLKRYGTTSGKVSPRSPPQLWTTSMMLVRFRDADQVQKRVAVEGVGIDGIGGGPVAAVEAEEVGRYDAAG